MLVSAVDCEHIHVRTHVGVCENEEGIKIAYNIAYWMQVFNESGRKYRAIRPVCRNVLLRFSRRVARACLGSR